jgi:hypothetical protein
VRNSILKMLCAGLIVSVAWVGTAAAAETTVEKPGRVVTTLVKTGAIVEAVNKDTRELKLLDPRGNRFTVVADELVSNFDQIEPRDRIVIEYLESVAVVVAPAGSEPPVEDALVLSVAEAGDKPGIEGVDTQLMVATVESINAADRLVTLKNEFGELRTIKVSENARLDLVEIGDQLRLRVTRAVAVSVVAPDAS